MKKVAMFYICTGKYNLLWKEFYESSEEFFLRDFYKEYFVFTDAEKLEYENQNSRIHRIKQEKMPWPYPALYRYKMFGRISDDVKDFDYVFFFNANALFLKEITDNMILPDSNKKELLTVLKHPAYRFNGIYDCPYDRNYKCRAHVSYRKGKDYIQSCIIGATTAEFTKMAKKLENDTDKDLSKQVIALWHDESYLNKYIIGKKYKLLPIQFGSNSDKVSEDAVIWMRPKKLYFDVDKFKANSDYTELGKFNKFINKISHRIVKNKDVFKCDKVILKKQKGAAFAFFWGLKNYWKIYFKG